MLTLNPHFGTLKWSLPTVSYRLEKPRPRDNTGVLAKLGANQRILTPWPALCLLSIVIPKKVSHLTWYIYRQRPQSAETERADELSVSYRLRASSTLEPPGSSLPSSSHGWAANAARLLLLSYLPQTLRWGLFSLRIRWQGVPGLIPFSICELRTNSLVLPFATARGM